MGDLINIENKNGILLVSSREVAERFEKEHRHVLESIRNLAAENSATKNMFIESNYLNRGKEYPEYLLTRDGFSLLAMGFTGSKALEWKLKYLEAFNRMEAEIKNRTLPSGQNLIAMALIEANRILEEKDITIKVQTQQIEELKPLAAYVKTILNNKSLVTVEQIAQDYGMSAQKLNKTLHELHIQYKGGNGQWILYQEHKQFGYVHSETISFKRSDGRPDTTMHTKWTQAGRMFLYETLKENEILPLIERDLEGKAI